MPEYITKDQAYLCMLENWDGDMLPGDYDDLLREIPPADVAPVVHAYWLGIEGDGYDPEGNIVWDTFECTNCGEEHYADGEPTWDYCPHCGARMTEKPTTEYGKGYFLKKSLLDLVEWDNDIEQWVISDDDFHYLMTNENFDKRK